MEYYGVSFRLINLIKRTEKGFKKNVNANERNLFFKDVNMTTVVLKIYMQTN